MQLFTNPLYTILSANVPGNEQPDIPDVETLGPQHRHLFCIYPVYGILGPSCILVQNHLSDGSAFLEFWGCDNEPSPSIVFFHSLAEAENALNNLLDVTSPEPVLDDTDTAQPIP